MERLYQKTDGGDAGCSSGIRREKSSCAVSASITLTGGRKSLRRSVQILLARFRRWVHSIGIWFRPWNWYRRPPCCCEDFIHYEFNMGHTVRRVELLRCSCGIDWYRRPGFDEDEIMKCRTSGVRFRN